MATLNVSIVDGDGLDGEVLGEAVCALQWAAEAGPFSLSLHRLGGRLAPLPSDAVLLGRRPFGESEHQLHRQMGIFANVRALRVIPSWARPSDPVSSAQHVDWMIVRSAPRDLWTVEDTTSHGPLDRVLEAAAELAGARTGRLALVSSNPPPSIATGRRDGVEFTVMSPRELVDTTSGDPQCLDVVVLSDAPAVQAGTQAQMRLGPAALVSSAWLGERGQLYATFTEGRPSTPGASTARAVGEAILSVALLLDFTAARHGLANTLRQSLGLAFDDLSRTGAERLSQPPTHTGQAVFERLEERFPLCVSW